MEIEFKCPHCGVVTYFDASYLGQSWQCRECRNEVTVRARGKIRAPDGQNDVGDPVKPKSFEGNDSHDESVEPNSGRANRPSRYGLMLVIVALVFGTRVIFYNWFRPRTDSNPYLKYMAEEEAARAEYQKQLLSEPRETKPWVLSEEDLEKLKSNGHLVPVESPDKILPSAP